MMKRFSALFLAVLLSVSLSACAQQGAVIMTGGEGAGVSQGEQPPETGGETAREDGPEAQVSEDGSYNSKEEVALYLNLYGHLPANYISKQDAQDLGWSGGSVEPYAGAGSAIGGSKFGNYEGSLPEGHSYRECDIDTVGTDSRGAKRLVYSDDGLIYYTQDHYQSFELLYGEP